MTPVALPRLVHLAAGVAILFLFLPLAGVLVRVPWADVPALLVRPASVDALRLSLVTCTASTVIAVLLGLPLALAVARTRGVLLAALRTVSALPMVLPPVVAGLALLVTWGRRGVLGQHLSVLGIEVGFSTVAVVMAQVFVAMPYFVVTVESALRGRDGHLERVASQLGAAPGTVLRRVTLPLLAPAVLGGAAMTFARALGEFGATLTFAGSLQGVTRTLPLEIYLAREADTDAALALALVLVAVAAALMGASAWATGATATGGGRRG